MDNLNLNPPAVPVPSNRAEYIALLDEALRLTDELLEQIKAATSEMERRAGTS